MYLYYIVSSCFSLGPKKSVRDVNPGNPFEPSYVYRMLQAVQVNPHFKVSNLFINSWIRA